MPTRPQQITLLLVGPTGSGKTSFVNRVLDRTGSQEKRPKVRDGLHPSTKECGVYRFTHMGTEFSIIDTPGLQDDPAKNFAVIKQMAIELETQTPGNPEPRVNGAIYFHRITGKTFTRSDRICLNIFEAICGERFYPRVACLTTMWDDIEDDKKKFFDSLSKELKTDYMSFCGRGTGVFDLKGDSDVDRLLKTFSQARDRDTELQLEKEIRKLSSRRYMKTTAGRKVSELVNKDGVCGCVIL